jgi:glycerol-3-phosphate cytidylyltransferase
MKKKRYLVDMSATLIHHGHIRLLKSVKKLGGELIVALTIDEEIIKKKGYIPELNFKEREEVLRAIKFVDDVIPSPWLIDNNYLIQNKIDFLVHGSDNSNNIESDKLIILPRTEGVSSSLIRARVLNTISAIIENKEFI